MTLQKKFTGHRHEGTMPSNSVTYRLLDRLIKDIVRRGGYSQTLHDALSIVSAISRGTGMMMHPERQDTATLRAQLSSNLAMEEVIED